MSVRNGLQQDGILGDLIPVNILEILLLQNGEKEASHGVIAVGRHGRRVLEDARELQRTGIEREAGF